MMRVVVFTGGRGASVLSARLLADPGVDVTLAINGYDDGASTGEVRRFLGDSLGPSDFRKNASLVASAKGTASPELVALLDTRLAADMAPDAAIDALRRLADGRTLNWPQRHLPLQARVAVGDRLHTFLDACASPGQPFDFADCAIGNLVFAGAYLLAGRRFNLAVDDYCSLLGLPAGLIDNVTDGVNACLVAVEEDGTVRGTEASIVGAPVRTSIHDIFLIERPLTPGECEELAARGRDAACAHLRRRSVPLRLNERLASRIDRADLILYAPGTQHSSLFPSYLTEGLPARIAGNLTATKLLVTNLQSDMEITHQDAATLVRRALYFLTHRGAHPLPAPCFVTHCILNDPGHADELRPLVPLGQVQSFEDPRMIRIDRFEDGETGRHDAAKVLQPFIEAKLAPPSRPRVAVLLYGARNETSVAQSLLEIARTTLPRYPGLTVFVGGAAPLPDELLARLPFAVESYPTLTEAEWWLRLSVDAHEYDFVALFESAGAYRGEELAALLPYLNQARLSAVWGSRRLSLRDIREAYRHRKYPDWATRTASRFGSHLLSLAYLLFHGRYVSDTLSGLRILRAGEYVRLTVPADHPAVNHHLLTALLTRRADFLEVPVQFLPSAGASHRFQMATGLASLAWICVAGLVRLAPLSRLEP